jgi:hypothetical protein
MKKSAFQRLIRYSAGYIVTPLRHQSFPAYSGPALKARGFSAMPLKPYTIA